MKKAEWRDDPRKEGGGNTSCVSIRPGTTNQWCATMCSSANPHAPDGSEASCPEAMCSCTAEARKQLNDERDEVLANWKEAESRVRGAKPLTAYPDGLPPTDLDGDDPSLPQLPRAPLPPPLPRHPFFIPQPRTHAPKLTPTLTYPRVLRSPPFRPPGTQRWRYRRPGPTSPRRAGPLSYLRPTSGAEANVRASSARQTRANATITTLEPGRTRGRAAPHPRLAWKSGGRARPLRGRLIQRPGTPMGWPPWSLLPPSGSRQSRCNEWPRQWTRRVARPQKARSRMRGVA